MNIALIIIGFFPQLFDEKRSTNGRLRWSRKIKTIQELSDVLQRPYDCISELVDMYLNSYKEKEKLWVKLGLKGRMREKCDKEIFEAIIDFTASSNAVFCIETIVDWLIYSGVLVGDPYQYRINKPGLVSSDNWSFRLPISVEDLIKQPLNKDIKRRVKANNRLVKV